MGLSQDPEKRARQIAALKKGNPRAFSRGEPGSEGSKPPAKARKSQARPTVRAGGKPPAKARTKAPASKPPAKRQPSVPKPSGGGFFSGLLDH